MEDFNNICDISILNNSKDNIKRLLEKILNTQILDIKFEGIEHFNSITEYDFSLLKAKLIYEDGKKDSIDLKMIKGGKIKESIFCYWSLLYEKYMKKNQSGVAQKAIITQLTSDENSSNLVLTLDEKLNYYVEINLVELKSFLKKYKNRERWVKSLGIKNEDILFIGKKMY